MCDAGFGWRQECAACITYACRVGASNARGQKTFLLNLHRYIDTQGRGVHGPDERGLERLFIHNVKLYNCAVACVKILNLHTKPKTPSVSLVNII
jgi:hypothetical protein